MKINLGKTIKINLALTAFLLGSTAGAFICHKNRLAYRKLALAR
ncbi:hypothetical protein NIES4073_29680 [Kalymmatonema gypsitolerans NIES-4073]|nr:hypothetical protein NIES4073_29680 [Scytonema sp. NIES-4073]